MGKLARVLVAAVASGLACGSRSELWVSRDATVEPESCDACSPDAAGDERDAGEEDAALDREPDVVDAPDEPVCCSPGGNGCSAQGCACEASTDCCEGTCVQGLCSLPFCTPSSSQGACFGPGQYCACLMPGESRPAPFDISGCLSFGMTACVNTPAECLPDGCAGPSTCACLLARMAPDANPCPEGVAVGCRVSGWDVVVDCQLGERVVDGGR